MDWVVNVVKDLGNNTANNASKEMERLEKQSIYKVPRPSVSDEKNNPYKPQVVSFGPYHHDDDPLKPMESHKDRALLHFLKRSNSQSLETIYKSLSEEVQSLKDNYDSLGNYDDDKFLKMMILDGCFLIEILLASRSKSDYYSDKDPIFSDHGRLYIMPLIKRDMLMLENQLPMMVLDKLIVGIESAKGRDILDINKLVLEFCGFDPSAKTVGKCLHVLDVVRKSMIFLEEPPQKEKGDHGSPRKDGANNIEIVLSAIELDEAGVQFKLSASKSLRDISFERGVLRLPQIIIDDTTESTFLNLIAFERCHVGLSNAITSYICFMDSLIDDGRDINFLHSKNIVWNVMGSNQAAADLFNNISKDLTIDPYSALSEVQGKINNYWNQPWNKHRANLVRTYFRSPWAIISVFAAFLLFGLTIMQTGYSISDYYRK